MPWPGDSGWGPAELDACDHLEAFQCGVGEYKLGVPPPHFIDTEADNPRQDDDSEMWREMPGNHEEYDDDEASDIEELQDDGVECDEGKGRPLSVQAQSASSLADCTSCLYSATCRVFRAE